MPRLFAPELCQIRFAIRTLRRHIFGMANITVKDIPDDLHAVLKSEAEANFRSLAQEILARLQRSLDFDTATRRDQKWIDEALASGPEEPFNKEKFKATLERGLEKAKSHPA
jgi:plasmid stability protein